MASTLRTHQMSSAQACSNTRHTRIDTSLGELLLVASDVGHHTSALIGLYFGQHSCPPSIAAIGTAIPCQADPIFTQTEHQLHEYLLGTRRNFQLPIALIGNDFSQRVWRVLRTIAYGQTCSYGTIAAALGNRRWAQRVGQAVGHNPISVIVPCHRVLGADGSLTGYAGGLDRKRTLLALEAPNTSSAARLF